MSDLLIRNLEESTVNNLKERARKNNRSLQAELKSLLEVFSGLEANKVKEEVVAYSAELEKKGENFPDSTDELREERER